MDSDDKKILENEMSVKVARMVRKWCDDNEVYDPVVVHATVSHPSCYLDDAGVIHTGSLIAVDCDIVDDDDDDY